MTLLNKRVSADVGATVSVHRFASVVAFLRPTYVERVSIAGEWSDVARICDKYNTMLYDPFLYLYPLPKFEMLRVGGVVSVVLIQDESEALRGTVKSAVAPGGRFCGGFHTLDFSEYAMIWGDPDPNPFNLEVPREVIVRGLEFYDEFDGCNAARIKRKSVEYTQRDCDNAIKALIKAMKNETLNEYERNVASALMLNTLECVTCEEVRGFIDALLSYMNERGRGWRKVWIDV